MTGKVCWGLFYFSHYSFILRISNLPWNGEHTVHGWGVYYTSEGRCQADRQMGKVSPGNRNMGLITQTTSPSRARARARAPPGREQRWRCVCWRLPVGPQHFKSRGSLQKPAKEEEAGVSEAKERKHFKKTGYSTERWFHRVTHVFQIRSKKLWDFKAEVYTGRL